MEKINVLNLAAYIQKRYARENNYETIDESKIHKLLYFIQREALIQFNTLLFDADFYAWQYGPVLHEIRTAYSNNTILTTKPTALTNEQQSVIDYVFNQYSQKSSWSLSRLTRGEKSWKHAREGISEYEKSDILISIEDIKSDAQRQLTRRNKLKLLKMLNKIPS